MTSPSYPAALDALANPGPTTETDDTGFELDIVVARLQNCVMAIEQKLGIGVGAPPATAAVLRRTATGASGWGQLGSGDITPGQVPVLLGSTGILAAPLASATFTGISQAFSSLELRIVGSSSAAVVAENVKLQINGSSVAGYYNQYVAGTGAASNGGEGIAQTAGEIGLVAAASASPAGWMGTITAWLHGYAVATRFRTVQGISYAGWGTVTGNQQVLVKGTTFTLAGAITSLAVFPATGQWAAGSIISLYGWP
jgi:hypothetical protein